METARRLLEQVRRKQILICAYTGLEDANGGPRSLAELSSLLELSLADCQRLVDRLQKRGLVSADRTGESAGIQLTARGRRLLERMISG